MQTSNHKILMLFFSITFSQIVIGQNTNAVSKLPINIVTAVSDSSKPLVLYITGDGGWNKFSKALSQEFANKGYPVVALNANKYFWDKKTAQQTATDVGLLIKYYLTLWKKKKILLVGYSFGADVLPFVYNNLGTDLQAQVVNISLLSPSAKTDFEIHIMVMLGSSGDGESVPSAINKISNKQLTLIFGKDEHEFPLKELTIKNYVLVRLTGGHHYDGDEATVCNTILAYTVR